MTNPELKALIPCPWCNGEINIARLMKPHPAVVFSCDNVDYCKVLPSWYVDVHLSSDVKKHSEQFDEVEREMRAFWNTRHPSQATVGKALDEKAVRDVIWREMQASQAHPDGFVFNFSASNVAKAICREFSQPEQEITVEKHKEEWIDGLLKEIEMYREEILRLGGSLKKDKSGIINPPQPVVSLEEIEEILWNEFKYGQEKQDEAHLYKTAKAILSLIEGKK